MPHARNKKEILDLEKKIFFKGIHTLFTLKLLLSAFAYTLINIFYTLKRGLIASSKMIILRILTFRHRKVGNFYRNLFSPRCTVFPFCSFPSSRVTGQKHTSFIWNITGLTVRTFFECIACCTIASNKFVFRKGNEQTTNIRLSFWAAELGRAAGSVSALRTWLSSLAEQSI